MVKENCFAFRSLPKSKNGIKWTEDRCDALVEFVCDDKNCPFYKDRANVVRYQYKYNNSQWNVGYQDIVK